MGVGVILGEKYVRGHFRLNGWCWRLLMRGWSVSEDHWTRWAGGARPDSRFQSRRGGRQSLKRRNTFVETARERGAARFTSHESRQHRAAASARARQVTVLPEWAPAGVEHI